MIAVLLIAVSLALDAFAVSVTSGIIVKNFSVRDAVKMGLYFGAFQFIMPLIGWSLGSGMSALIEAVDHFIAFGLLALIGGRMVYSALRKRPQPKEEAAMALTTGRLMSLALATSIDALAVGVSMAFIDVNILASAAVIGVVCFGLSLLGGLAGKRLGNLFRQRAELLGGLVLIGIGVRILIEHLTGK